MSRNSEEESCKSFRPHCQLSNLWEELQRWSEEATRWAMKFERHTSWTLKRTCALIFDFH